MVGKLLLLVQRHVRIGPFQDKLHQVALFGVARNDGRTAITSLQNVFQRAQVQATLLPHSSMALEAIPIQQRLDLPKPQFICLPGCSHRP